MVRRFSGTVKILLICGIIVSCHFQVVNYIRNLRDHRARELQSILDQFMYITVPKPPGMSRHLTSSSLINLWVLQSIQPILMNVQMEIDYCSQLTRSK